MLLLHSERIARRLLVGAIAVRFARPNVLQICLHFRVHIRRSFLEHDLLDLFLHLHDSLHHGHLGAFGLLLVECQTLLN